MKNSILFIDDEKNILTALKRLCSYEEYNVYTANNGAEAIDILKNNDIWVIVTDMQMPEMNGIELLQQVRELRKDAVRMVLSGYSDNELILNAINKGHIWRYLTKPWNDQDLLITIKNAFEYYEKKVEVKKLLAEVEQKNLELKEFNDKLENEVKKRTTQLENEKEVMKMIVSNEDKNIVIQKICNLISFKLKNRDVFIYLNNFPSIFTRSRSVLDPEIENIIRNRNWKKVAKNNTKYLLIDIEQNSKNYGVLIVEGKYNHDQVIEEIDEYLTLLMLVVFHHQAVDNLPQLLESIDDIIQEQI